MTAHTNANDKPALGRVMVIGGKGFLGHHIVQLLVQRYRTERVFVVDIQIYDGPDLKDKATQYFQADISDFSKLLSLFKETRPDVVIHTASPLPQVDTASSRMLYDKINVKGTESVVQACQACGVKALVYTSSASVVSDHVSDLINADERWPRVRGADQPEYYAESKSQAEDIVLAANRQGPSGLLTTVIRPSAIFGEGDKMLIPRFVNMHRRGQSLWQIGGNGNLFDFTYVGNVAYAHLLAAEVLLATTAAPDVESSSAALRARADGECFFVTNGSPVYFWDFIRAVWGAAGLSHDISRVWVLSRTLGLVLGLLCELFYAVMGKKATLSRQTVTFSCMTRYYNISKARQRLNYEPIVSLKEGIARSVEWYLELEKTQDGIKV